MGQEDVALLEALGSLPGALQLLQVEVVGAAVPSLGPQPRAAVVT